MQLHGWKEIAAYLGRGVRAAQRWERELKLPVRRMKTAAGQTVVARSEDLDRWRARHAILRDQPDDPISDPASTASRVRWMTAGAVAIALLAGSWWMLHATPAPPVQFRLAGSALDALDASGRVVWHHAFDFAVGPYPSSARARLASQIVRADIDGDGRPEVLVMTPGQPPSPSSSDRVTCFEEDGRVRWTFDPSNIVLQFRAGTYRGPWAVQDIAVSPADGPQRVFIAIGHRARWASAVVEIDRHGQATTRFVQAGSVFAIQPWNTPDGLRIAAGGTNDEFAAASVAILDPDRVATSPQTAGSPYQCLGCPAAPPLAYYVLPRTDVNEASDDRSNRVATLTPVDGNRLMVTTAEDGESGASMTYWLNPDRSIAAAAPDNEFWEVHRRQEAAGRLKDRASTCRERGTHAVQFHTAGRGWIMLRAPASPARP
jgi:hypothetical protein